MAMRKKAAAALVLLSDEEEVEKKDKRTWMSNICTERESCGATAVTASLLSTSTADPRVGNFSNYFRMDVDLFEELLAKVARAVYKQGAD